MLPLRESIGNQIRGNYIGVDGYGTVAFGNGLNGVLLSGAASDELGTVISDIYNITNTHSNTITGNLIAGNPGSGIGLMEGATHNMIADNDVGTNVIGKGPLADALGGVTIENSAYNTVTQNLISGNIGSGIHIADPPSSIASEGNWIRANIIGLNKAGGVALPNSGAGVSIQNSSVNVIGGAEEADRNFIAGNGGDGIVVQRSPDFTATLNHIEQNYIGVLPTGDGSVGNGGSGVRLFNAQNTMVMNNVIGGNGAGMSFAAPST